MVLETSENSIPGDATARPLPLALPLAKDIQRLLSEWEVRNLLDAIADKAEAIAAEHSHDEEWAVCSDQSAEILEAVSRLEDLLFGVAGLVEVAK